MPAPKGGNKGSFKKGRSGNPAGKKPLPEDIKIARALSYEEMCRTVIDTRNMTVEELKETDMEKITLGKRAIINAYAKLEYKGIKEYEDRLWGKAQDNIDLTMGGTGKVRVVMNWGDEDDKDE